MPIELTSNTNAGARLVAIAEQLSEALAARAAEHDRDGTYPFEAIDALKAAGYFAAPVPIELGGLGVSSAHDLVVAASRLARGDASVAIGMNMHLVAVLNMGRQHEQFTIRATPAGVDRFAGLDWTLGRGGTPLLTDALAVLECDIVAEHPAGDDWIVVGRVDNLRIAPVNEPLVFFGGEFGTLQ